MHGQNPSRTQEEEGNMDILPTGAGKRGRPPADVAARLQGPTCVPDKPSSRDSLCVAFDANKGVVKEHAQWRSHVWGPHVPLRRRAWRRRFICGWQGDAVGSWAKNCPKKS